MKHLLTRLCITTVVIIAIFHVASPDVMATEKFKIKKGGEKWLIFIKQEDGWKAKSPALTLKVKVKGKIFEFKTPSAEYVLKEKKAGTYKIYNPDDSLLFKVKFYDGKRKISQSEDDKEPWSIKLKNDETRYKVKKGEKKLGQIKFYPDDLKIKVKDTSNIKMCSMKSGRLRSAPAVCFFDELSEEQQLILFTFFMIFD